MKIDVEGNIVWKPDTDYGINKSGYVIHGAIHKARPTQMRHPHTYPRRDGGVLDEMRAAAAVADLDPLPRPIGYHDYEGPAIDLPSAKRWCATLGRTMP